MSAANLIPHIRDALATLRPAERKVADMVLSDVDFAMRASITELAQRADVSEPSVDALFCRTVGAHGLRDFKMQLAQSVAGGMPYASQAVARDDDIQTLFDKVGEAAIEGIAHARSALDPIAVRSGASGARDARGGFIASVWVPVRGSSRRMRRCACCGSTWPPAPSPTDTCNACTPA